MKVEFRFRTNACIEAIMITIIIKKHITHIDVGRHIMIQTNTQVICINMKSSWLTIKL